MDYDVLIIGGGFGGCYALHQLRKSGFSAHIVEAGSALGGVWHRNSYPGARVDSETPYYQLSLREVWKDWTWSQRFPGHAELKRYFTHVDKVLDISKDVSYNTVVVGADFDTVTAKWIIETDSGRIITSRFLVTATGSSIKRYEPEFAGKDLFKGIIVHPAAWPVSGIDLENKRVAIIGSGATGVQCVQEIAKQPGVKLTVYVRNVNIALPMRQREISELEQDSLKAIYKTLFRLARDSSAGLPCDGPTQVTKETTTEEREAWWEELWKRGAFNFQTGQYTDFLVDAEANRLIYEFWAKKTKCRVQNPKKRAILVPDKQPFPFGTKRSSLEQDYYECMDQDNVEVVDVKKTSIREWTARGIVTEDAPTALTNAPVFIEQQVDFITDFLVKLRMEKITSIEPRRSAEEHWKKTVQAIHEALLFSKSDTSWYVGGNIPGKKKEQLNYLGGIPQYLKECREGTKDWSNFNVVVGVGNAV
ncbi:uncharacterized protein N0V96_001175 [Colletotrichum fioriniae]|uniref:uncharacterized protein n=1 Tax=Colletotrichum fioriniae TaxID=710243 RepID=UPI0032D9E13B|nr:hypothetical protein N0V96_001175 [Colletotrichum fioriniae]